MSAPTDTPRTDLAHWVTRCTELPGDQPESVVIIGPRQRLDELRDRVAQAGIGCISCGGVHPATELTTSDQTGAP